MVISVQLYNNDHFSTVLKWIPQTFSRFFCILPKCVIWKENFSTISYLINLQTLNSNVYFRSSLHILSSKSLVCLTSLLFSDCYKGIEFGLPNENPETDGFVNVSHSEIIARNEMDMVEKKFKEMGLPVDGEELDESDDGIRFGSFENLNDISHQEHHQNLPFRNDI